MSEPEKPKVELEEAPLLNARGELRGGMERRVEAEQEMKAKALELRKAGATYDQIARQLGYHNRGNAYRAVKTALQDITLELAEEVRDMELARLDTALLAIWPEVRKGSLPHIDRFLKIQNQRAQYLGLYSPVKIAPTTPSGDAEWSAKSDSDLVTEFSGLIESIRTRQASRANE